MSARPDGSIPRRVWFLAPKNECYNCVTKPWPSDRDSGVKRASNQMLVKLSQRERATVLAALRRWLSDPAARNADSIATNRGKHKPLDDGEIQQLCKRITQTEARGDVAPLCRHSKNGARVQKHGRSRD